MYEVDGIVTPPEVIESTVRMSHPKNSFPFRLSLSAGGHSHREIWFSFGVNRRSGGVSHSAVAAAHAASILAIRSLL